MILLLRLLVKVKVFTAFFFFIQISFITLRPLYSEQLIILNNLATISGHFGREN